VHGAHDPFVPVAIAQRLHGAIPASTLDVIAGARHFAPIDAPDRVAAVLEGLLKR
jgi:3-oxoadipate enol-lactonase